MYGDLINSTSKIIHTRSRRHRNLIIVVLSVALVSIISAIAFSTWFALWILGTLIPLCGGYIFLDTRLVYKWRHEVTATWAAGELDLDVFVTAMRSITTLPQKTLNGMLAALPTKDRLPSATSLSPPEKEALARTLWAVSRCQSDRTLMLTLTGLLGLAAAALASILRTWKPLLGLAGIPLLYGFGALLVVFRLAGVRKYLREIPPSPGFEIKKYQAAAEKLDWSSVPEKRKRRFFESLTES